MIVALLRDAQADGGRVDEQDALVQVDAVGSRLRANGHRTIEIAVGLDLAAATEALRAARPQVAFNFVESIAGHGRLIHLAPALLEALGLPFTGCDSRSMFLTSDKLGCKRALAVAGIDTPPWLDAHGDGARGWSFPARAIVKSVWEDASLGLDDHSVVTASSCDELAAQIAARAGDLGGEAFAEAFVDGREFNLSLLQTDEGVRVLPVAEIRFDDFPPDKPRLVGYRAKWDEQSFEYRHTPRSFEFAAEDATLLARLRSLALDCWRTLGLRGYARVDFRVDAEGRPWVLEINANPCLSPDAGFVAAAERDGLDLAAIAEQLLATALHGVNPRVPHPAHR